LDASLDDRLIRDLDPVPYGDYPDGLTLNPIKEPVRRNDNLAIRELREFRDQTT
jgi:hypothetical protein